MQVTLEIKKAKEPKFSGCFIGSLLFLLIGFLFLRLFKKPINYIKEKVFRKTAKLKIKADTEVVKNEKYHLTLSPVTSDDHEFECAKKFNEAVDKADEVDTFIVKSHRLETQIDNFHISSFRAVYKNQILLQKIRMGIGNKPTSDLISFDPNNGTYETVNEIGLFELEYFNEDNQVISGNNYNKDQEILVTVLDDIVF